MSKNTKIIVGLLVALVVSLGVMLGVSSKGEKLGGMIHTLSEDFRAGIRVGGTEVISSTRGISATTLTATGATSLGAAGSGVNWFEKVSALTSDTTLTASQSGTTFTMGTAGLDLTLPAVASSNGVRFKFVVSAAFATTNMTIVSAEGDNIDGNLIVAGAVVACDLADVVTFVATSEDIGDFVELYSNGTTWFVGSNGTMTASNTTCSG